MNKLERDGKTAIVYAPGYGAGWSTWNRKYAEELCMRADIAEAVLASDVAKAKQIAEGLGDYVCVLGADDLEVEWVTKGTIFKIDEYDGSESISIVGNEDYFTA
jgi:hypothetical protein